MLEKPELARRLKALRALRGYKQTELEKRLGQAGLKKTDLGKLERGEKDLSEAMLGQLVAILRAPPAYFEEPDLDLVLFRTPPHEGAPDRGRADDAPRRLAGLAQRERDQAERETSAAPGAAGGTQQS